MTKAYQVVTERGLEIPRTLCRLAHLEGEAIIEVDEGRMAIRAAGTSRDAARRIANKYVVLHLGDVLKPTDVEWSESQGMSTWKVTVMNTVSGEKRGELYISTDSGAVVSWRPLSEPERL